MIIEPRGKLNRAPEERNKIVRDQNIYERQIRYAPLGLSEVLMAGGL
jgi:hypothetical protein